MRRHILSLLLLAVSTSLLHSYRSNHRRPLAQTLRKFMTAYLRHYRAGYLVGLQTDKSRVIPTKKKLKKFTPLKS